MAVLLTTKEKEIFRRIEVFYDDSAVHVTSDAYLKAFMGYDLDRALYLASYIKKRYQKKFDKKLRITTLSLAVELLGHFFVQEICLKIKGRFATRSAEVNVETNPIIRACDMVLRRTDVIDCGERFCDNNRIVWDVLAVPVKMVKKSYE